MLDSANQTISELKAELNDLQQEVTEARQAAEEAEGEVSRREMEASEETQNLRSEFHIPRNSLDCYLCSCIDLDVMYRFICLHSLLVCALKF